MRSKLPRLVMVQTTARPHLTNRTFPRKRPRSPWTGASASRRLDPAGGNHARSQSAYTAWRDRHLLHVHVDIVTLCSDADGRSAIEVK
jgi:hypothetical protein